MITLIHNQIEELTQEKYDQLISKLFNGQKLIKSPCCEGGVLEKHGYYERGYKALNGREEIRLKILRVRCVPILQTTLPYIRKYLSKMNYESEDKYSELLFKQSYGETIYPPRDKLHIY